MDGESFSVTGIREGLARAQIIGYPVKVYAGQSSELLGVARDEKELAKFLKEGLAMGKVHLVPVHDSVSS